MIYRENIKKSLLVNAILAILVGLYFTMVTMVTVDAASSGSCGDSVNWTLNGGVLTISGNGAMNNFTENTMAPWYNQREEITAVCIENGVTSIGSLAFYKCESIQSVSIASTVSSIGDLAFASCKNLTRVSLGDSVQSIGDNAFNRCEALTSIRLPNSLVEIGYQAFYCCSSLASIYVPATVSSMGSSVFAYCTSLVEARIEASITTLPSWTFYGCSALVNVSLPSIMQNVGRNAFFACGDLENTYHDGTEEGRNEISNQIVIDIPGFAGVQEGDESSIESTVSKKEEVNSDGSTVKQEVEVINSENSSINITVENTITSSGKIEYDIKVDAVVDNANGWNEVITNVDSYINTQGSLENDNTDVNVIEINVSLNGVNEVPNSVLQSFAGKDIILNIHTGINSVYSIECNRIDAEDITGSYKLEYNLTKNEYPTKEHNMLVGNAESYFLKFTNDVPYNTIVKLLLGQAFGEQYASIYKKEVGGSWLFMQSVIIDHQGMAAFYLEQIKASTEYLVAINAEGGVTHDALIASSMEGEYGTLTDAEGNKYEITGTKSSLNITFGRLNLILIGGIVVITAVVGVVMLVIFKRRSIFEQIEREVLENDMK